MALTLSQMQTRVSSVIRDPTNVFVSATDLTNFLNEAKTDLAFRIAATTKTSSGTTSGNTIAMPSDAVRPLSLRMGTNDVEFTDDTTFYEATDSGSSFTHTLARVHAGNIELYPTPSTGTAYTLRYTYEPADMSAAGDTSGLPSELDKKLVEYAKAQALYKMAEEGMGDRFMAMYESDLPPHPLGVSKTKPGPFSVKYEPGPFEHADYTALG